MVAQVISFFQRAPRHVAVPVDWTQQELAEFYRVESALIRAGIRVGTDRGLSDENEPWFCFYRSDDGEVVIHFARIDGEYLIAGPAYEEIARGLDFTSLVRNMVQRHPLIQRSERGSNISVHPAALLIAVVGTAFFKTGEARAAETGAAPSHSRPVLLQSSSNAALAVTGSVTQTAPYDTVQLPANQAVLILAAALLASDYRAGATALTQTSQTAIAAAAAALDFAPAPTAQISDAGLTPAASGHAPAAHDGPTETISSVLTLTSILSTMPSNVDTAAAMLTDAPSGEALRTFATNEGGNNGALDPQFGPQWALEVRLGWANSPSVEAVQLVRNTVGANGPQQISVIEVEKLPDVLAQIIAKGSHYATTPTLPSHAFDNLPSSPGQGDLGSGSSSNSGNGGLEGGSNSGSSNNGGSNGQTGGSNTPTDNGGGHAPQNPANPYIPPFATSEIVRKFIDYFVAHTKEVEIMVTGPQVVLYDMRLMHDIGSIEHLTSMSFTFDDGSSVSLVGDHSSFLNGGVLF